MNKLKVLGVIVVAVLIGVKASMYTLSEGRQAIITELGKPIGSPITKAGLHFKVPFIQEVRYVDKRILSWDGYPSEIPTKDKKYIKVDTTARWKITDALKFIQSVRNERGAKARLDAALDSATRDVISNNSLVEAVRNSNLILKKIEERKVLIAEKIKKGEEILEEEITGEIEMIKVGRERLSQLIVESASKGLNELGIELIDVQLRRISYESSVENKVYERMISERQRIAQKIRSIGQGEKAKIEGRIARDLRKIESEAYRQSQIIKGKGEAKATLIYARSLGQDPSFYAFSRSLQAYKKSFTNNINFILSEDSEFFKYMKKSK
jgi:membrane protease subunit HflC